MSKKITLYYVTLYLVLKYVYLFLRKEFRRKMLEVFLSVLVYCNRYIKENRMRKDKLVEKVD